MDDVLQPIPGYEGLYSITQDGRVWFHGRQRTYKGRLTNLFYPAAWKPQQVDKDGYPTVALTDSVGKLRQCKVHILVAKTFIPNPDNLPEVNHKDSNRANPNDWNLEWVTRQGNYSHAMVQGGKGNSYGFHGICYHPKKDKYQARVTINGRSKSLGYTSTAEDAARLYDTYVRTNNLDRPLNFPVQPSTSHVNSV